MTPDQQAALAQVVYDALEMLPDSRSHSLGLLAEVVQGRIHDRRREFRLWLIGIMVALASGFLALWNALNDDLAELSQEIDNVEVGVKRSVPAPDTVILSRARAVPTTSTGNLGTIPKATHELPEGSSIRFRIEDANGLYSIKADGKDDFDPYIDLYSIDNQIQTHIGSDDDSGGELSAEIRRRLDPQEIYELEVWEFFGKGGEVTVSVTLISEGPGSSENP
ncbi:hypothetical protein [Candidatus Palauibacter sp.]|uniref:hypothetical protein n=1 Tax=Candidatus Palauibacter sp. TaxID=3101350 RepID=UPI003B5A44A7